MSTLWSTSSPIHARVIRKTSVPQPKESVLSPIEALRYEQDPSLSWDVSNDWPPLFLSQPHLYRSRKHKDIENTGCQLGTENKINKSDNSNINLPSTNESFANFLSSSRRVEEVDDVCKPIILESVINMDELESVKLTSDCSIKLSSDSEESSANSNSVESIFLKTMNTLVSSYESVIPNEDKS